MTTKKTVSTARTKSGNLKKSVVKKAVKAVSLKKKATHAKKSKHETRKAVKSITAYVSKITPKKSKTTKPSTSPSRTITGKLRKSAVRNAVKTLSKAKKSQEKKNE